MVDSDRALTLALAPKAIAVPLGFCSLLLAGLAVRGHWGWSLALGLVVGATYGLVLERGIDFTQDALTLTPLLPLRPRQRFLWQDIGAPRFARGYAGVGKIKIPVSNGHYRFAGVIPRKSIDLTAIYHSESDSRTLHAAEVAALIQRSRLASDAR